VLPVGPWRRPASTSVAQPPFSTLRRQPPRASSLTHQSPSTAWRCTCAKCQIAWSAHGEGASTVDSSHPRCPTPSSLVNRAALRRTTTITRSKTPRNISPDPIPPLPELLRLSCRNTIACEVSWSLEVSYILPMKTFLSILSGPLQAKVALCGGSNWLQHLIPRFSVCHGSVKLLR
jgi:hypothetical protein